MGEGAGLNSFFNASHVINWITEVWISNSYKMNPIQSLPKTAINHTWLYRHTYACQLLSVFQQKDGDLNTRKFVLNWPALCLWCKGLLSLNPIQKPKWWLGVCWSHEFDHVLEAGNEWLFVYCSTKLLFLCLLLLSIKIIPFVSVVHNNCLVSSISPAGTKHSSQVTVLPIQTVSQTLVKANLRPN